LSSKRKQLSRVKLGKLGPSSTSRYFSWISADTSSTAGQLCSRGLQPAFAFGTLCPHAEAERGLKPANTQMIPNTARNPSESTKGENSAFAAQKILRDVLSIPPSTH